MNPKMKSAALSYIRAALSCAGALYLSGITDPKVLMNSFVAAFIAPLLKAIDPKSSDYGLGAK
jgi:hypothetical protein